MTTPRGPQPFAGQEKRLRLLAFVRQDSVVRVDKRVEDTAMVWPHLLVIEFIAAMVWSIGLFVIAAAFNAPLQDWLTFMAAIPYIDRSREGVGIWFTSPNGLRITIFAAVYATVGTFSLILLDAFLKAHGYIEFATEHFPGGKQLFPNYLIPIALMIGLSVLLVLIVQRLYAANTREWNMAIFTGFVAVYVVLTVVGTSLRGPGMDLFAPWAVPATHQCLEPKA